jgi:effector-binding domain-containing protein
MMPRFYVQRSIQIAASPDQVFDRVVNFNTWTTWSPWLIAEPNAQVTVTDNANDVGAVSAWKGEVVGAGEIEHQRVERPKKIEDEIRFVKPFRSKSNVVFELQQIDSGTHLTWHMHGSLPWFLFWMRPMMETFIGMDYDRGLRMLKEWIETGFIKSRTNVKGVVPTGPLTMLGVSDKCRVADVGESMEAAFKKATQLFQQNNLPTGGGMISVYSCFDMKAGIFSYISGYVVPESTPCPSDELTKWSLPAGKSFCAEHIGSYHHLGNAWSAANQIARYKKLKQSRVGTFELYRTTPPDTPDAELLTEIYLPLR